MAFVSTQSHDTLAHWSKAVVNLAPRVCDDQLILKECGRSRKYTSYIDLLGVRRKVISSIIFNDETSSLYGVERMALSPSTERSDEVTFAHSAAVQVGVPESM